MATLIDRLTEPYRQSVEDFSNQFVDKYFQNDHQWAQFVAVILGNTASFWLFASLLTLVDLTEPNGKLHFLQRYRIQQTGHTELKHKSLFRVALYVVRNQLIVGVYMYVLLMIKHQVLHWEPNHRVPSLSRLVCEFAVFVLSREVLFYYSHRILHIPGVYQRFHKQHHEWHSPIALMTLYCHPVEHLLTNITPVLFGPSVCNSHMITVTLWVVYVLAVSVYDHSWYHFPANPFSPVFHDFHHEHGGVGNYGLNGLLDWLHGTDKAFRQSAYFPRHRMYFSFTPPKDIHQQCSAAQKVK